MKSLLCDFVQQCKFIFKVGIKGGAVNGCCLGDIFDGDCIKSFSPQQISEGCSN
ncbi:hypothetical protein D3C86_2137440 [compost metagenome]